MENHEAENRSSLSRYIRPGSQNVSPHLMGIWNRIIKLFTMKEIKCNVAERLAALSVFNNPENKVATADLKVYLDDVAKFRLSDEDKVAVNWEELKQDAEKPELTTGFKWDDTKTEPKPIELDEFTRKFLEEKLTKLEVSATDPFAGAVLSLIDKLK